MRNVAERLGVRATALYRHVRDKDELLVLLADEISGEVEPIGQEPPWQERLTEFAWRVRRGLLVHRDAARLLAAVAPAGLRRMDHIEAMLRLLIAAGFPPVAAVRAAYHFNDLLAEGRRQLRALPADRYPTLVEHADLLAEDDVDGRFRLGLELFVRGLERVRPG